MEIPVKDPVKLEKKNAFNGREENKAGQAPYTGIIKSVSLVRSPQVLI